MRENIANNKVNESLGDHCKKKNNRKTEHFSIFMFIYFLCTAGPEINNLNAFLTNYCVID